MRDLPWESYALCYDSGVDFFSEASLDESSTEVEVEIAQFETKRAQAICHDCPVRRECIESALEFKDHFGVWGGANQEIIRKALSVDDSGDAVPRARDMVCPYCNSSDLAILTRRRNQTQIECNACQLGWWAAKPLTVVSIRKRDVDDFGQDVE